MVVICVSRRASSTTCDVNAAKNQIVTADTNRPIKVLNSNSFMVPLRRNPQPSLAAKSHATARRGARMRRIKTLGASDQRRIGRYARSPAWRRAICSSNSCTDWHARWLAGGARQPDAAELPACGGQQKVAIARARLAARRGAGTAAQHHLV